MNIAAKRLGPWGAAGACRAFLLALFKVARSALKPVSENRMNRQCVTPCLPGACLVARKSPTNGRKTCQI
jgi:hypothetical protein